MDGATHIPAIVWWWQSCGADGGFVMFARHTQHTTQAFVTSRLHAILPSTLDFKRVKLKFKISRTYFSFQFVCCLLFFFLLPSFCLRLCSSVFGSVLFILFFCSSHPFGPGHSSSFYRTTIRRFALRRRVMAVITVWTTDSAFFIPAFSFADAVCQCLLRPTNGTTNPALK